MTSPDEERKQNNSKTIKQLDDEVVNVLRTTNTFKEVPMGEDDDVTRNPNAETIDTNNGGMKMLALPAINAG